MSGLSDLEARLLASLPNVDAFERLEVLGITGESFKTYGPMYSYIREMVEEHQTLPRLRDLVATFNVPDHVRRKPEEYDWLLEEFIKLTTAQQVQSIFDSNVDAYSDDPRAMVDGLLRDLGDLTVSEKRDVSVTDASAEKRMEAYGKNPLEEGWLDGIPTGLSFFDAICRVGWKPGELIGLVARTSIGKSWMLIYHGLIAWQAGKKVLFLSPELPQEEAEARWDTLLCGMSDIVVDALDFYRGFLPTKEQVALAAKSARRQDWTTLCSVEGRPFSLNEIPRLVHRYEPDLLIVDGLTFIQVGGRLQAWERVYQVSYGLKSIAVGANLPILVSHQANRAAAAQLNRPPALHEIFAGDGFAQACDRLLTLHPPYNTKNRLIATVQKFRRGEPEQGGLQIHFEPGRGKIHEVFDTATTGSSGDSGSNIQKRTRTARPVSIP